MQLKVAINSAGLILINYQIITVIYQTENAPKIIMLQTFLVMINKVVITPSDVYACKIRHSSNINKPYFF